MATQRKSATAKATRKHPTLANGKICYVEIPAVDIKRSADFLQRGFRLANQTAQRRQHGF
jgi:hypothetical protein